ncbi:response regulator, partial [Gilvimarinus sp. 1_MG-2023]|uniref:response regulator n=1 Tax=Gilvimarinus sp. 1_MG-2023 TaxID=3062638 RepID=UPI003FA590C8
MLVVDDHELVRSGISALLADANGIEVVGQAESGEQAIKFAREHEPDVILMDIQMPGI